MPIKSAANRKLNNPSAAKTMKTLSFLVSLAVVFALVGCAPKLDDARAAFCKDLGAYAKAVAAVGALGPESTVSDFTKLQ